MRAVVVLIFLVGATFACSNKDSPASDSSAVGARQTDAAIGADHREEALSMNTSREAAGAQEVWFNGVPLDRGVIDQLTEIYGMAPQPGRWWYDPASGLCGVEGQAAMGFMLPNHDFLGRLAENASHGTSAVFINGRRLTSEEVVFLSYFWQVPIQQGRYWLDGQGFTGFEGVSQPMGNIHMQAAMLAQQGRGQGGDNFWSSRLGAGNYDAASGAGYVSVPGHGPIGFGM